jgi:hypothetical protein
MKDKHSRSERISRTATITLNSDIETVFPLFGAIEEKKWAEGWNPIPVYPRSEKLEAGMVFLTEGNNDGESEYVWIVATYQPERHRVEYIVSTANRIWVIAVECTALSAFGTEARVTYTFTGLNPRGNELNREHIERMFARNLADWEEAINYFLRTGELLSS